MADKQLCVVSCARADQPLRPSTEHLRDTAVHKPCQGCGTDLLAAPSSVALEARDDLDMHYMCDQCIKANVHGPVDLAFAPGALSRDTPDDRRRRSELLAHGFRELPDA